MKIIYGISKIPPLKKPVLALGVFDGVHRGHSRILRAAVRTAARIRGTSVVFTFCPHPQNEESLYSLSHRLRLIESFGFDVCVVLRFDHSFSSRSPQWFVRRVLKQAIAPVQIFVGENFRFGKDAAGDYRFLRDSVRHFGCRVVAFAIMRSGGLAISSTRIRQYIKNGRLHDAQRLLGRRVSILGTVIRGDSRGAGLGFPTANIDPHHEVIPPPGVYAVRVHRGGATMRGICYIGTKPTFEKPGRKIIIETHIFSLRRDLYGQDLEIQFIRRLRGDMKFASASALVAQIKRDIVKTTRILSRC